MTRRRLVANVVVAEVNEIELAVRIIEASGTKRPADVTPEQALAAIGEVNRRMALSLAKVAINYLTECMAAVGPLTEMMQTIEWSAHGNGNGNSPGPAGGARRRKTRDRRRLQ